MGIFQTFTPYFATNFIHDNLIYATGFFHFSLIKTHSQVIGCLEVIAVDTSPMCSAVELNTKLRGYKLSFLDTNSYLHQLTILYPYIFT